MTDQFREVEMAIIGRGKYDIRAQYQSWKIAESKWFTMSTQQREQHLKKFSNAAVDDICSDSSSISPPLVFGSDVSMASSLSVTVDQFSHLVRAPRTCLEGIWRKATELIKTDGAIVAAPGVQHAKLVLSSRGNKPHLVTIKRGGVFSCDNDCPNWKAMGICSHSVAAAEVSKKLPEFVEWYTKSKRTPNLSKFAEVTMPKGRGNKGSVSSTKRKAPVPVNDTIENPYLSASSPALDSNVPLQGYSQNPYPVQPTWPHGSATRQYPQPSSAWPQPSTVFSPSQQSAGYRINTPSTSSSWSSPPSSFVLCKIAGNVSVCTGCRNKYQKNPLPPDDMCIKHQEWCEYTPSGAQTPQSRYGNVYYHFDPQCVWHRRPWFLPAALEIPPDTYAELTEVHMARLRTLFQLNI